MTAVVEAEATEVEATDSTEETKAPGKRGRKPESRDFTEWKSDHEEFANYINSIDPTVGITPGQVKAAWLLRGDWTNSPERVAAKEARKAEDAEAAAERARKKAERDAEKAKYANETPEEKEKRLKKEKAVKAAERAKKRAAELIAKAEALVEQADVESDTVDAAAEFSEVAEATEVSSEDAVSTEARKPARRKRPQ